jgi:hypothetical protein
MQNFGPLFDQKAGEDAKAKGMVRAATCRNAILAQARDAVRRKALSRPDHIATVDDAYLWLAKMGKDAGSLGNAAGSLFRASEWECLPVWAPSRRKSNHARMVRVWRLRP